jgi:hypothetical protein
MSLPLGLGTDETVGHMELLHVLSGSLDCSDQLTQATACLFSHHHTPGLPLPSPLFSFQSGFSSESPFPFLCVCVLTVFLLCPCVLHVTPGALVVPRVVSVGRSKVGIL